MSKNDDSPCDFSLALQGTAPGEQRYVRLLAKDGPKILAQIDMTPADLAAALLGDTVTAAIVTRVP